MKLFFFFRKNRKNAHSRKLFWIPNDFSERTERKERRVAESEAEGCGVRSEAGVPFRGGLAEDVAARSGRRSDPKRLEWSEWRKRRRDPKNVLENESIFSVLEEKNTKNEAKNVCSPNLAR